MQFKVAVSGLDRKKKTGKMKRSSLARPGHGMAKPHVFSVHQPFFQVPPQLFFVFISICALKHFKTLYVYTKSQYW
jgi:hypothetical protein